MESDDEPALSIASARWCSWFKALGGEHEEQRQSDKTETALQQRKETKGKQERSQLAQSNR